MLSVGGAGGAGHSNQVLFDLHTAGRREQRQTVVLSAGNLMLLHYITSWASPHAFSTSFSHPSTPSHTHAFISKTNQKASFTHVNVRDIYWL